MTYKSQKVMKIFTRLDYELLYVVRRRIQAIVSPSGRETLFLEIPFTYFSTFVRFTDTLLTSLLWTDVRIKEQSDFLLLRDFSSCSKAGIKSCSIPYLFRDSSECKMPFCCPLGVISLRDLCQWNWSEFATKYWGTDNNSKQKQN